MLSRLHNPYNCAIRLGNVLGTEGGVVKVFLQQILAGGPVTVTHAETTRYFLTRHEAVDLILLASELPGDGKILIPDLGKPVKILDLACRLIKEAGFDAYTEMPITFIGLRPGDKMTEDFASASDSVESTSDPRLSRVKSTEMHPNRFDALVADLAIAVDRHDLFSILETLRCMVPEYEASESLLRSLEGVRLEG